MKSLKINDLKSIACIANVGNISTAATKLGTSQANLSRLLSSIEAQIGLKIFDRSTRHVSLSDFGEALLPRILQALQANDDICHFIDSYKEKPIGQVTVAAPSGALSFISRHVIPAISTQQKDISVSLISYTLQPYSTNLVMHPEWDIMLSVSMPSDEDLIARQIGTFSMGFYAAPEFIKHNPIKNVSDLASNNSCILLKSLGMSHNTWSYKDIVTGELKSINVNGRYLCDQASYAVELARQGLGVVYAPLFLVMDDIKSGSLAPYISHESDVTYNAYLLYRNRKYQPHRVSVIIDAIVARLHEIEAQKEHKNLIY